MIMQPQIGINVTAVTSQVKKFMMLLPAGASVRRSQGCAKPLFSAGPIIDCDVVYMALGALERYSELP